MKSTRLVGVRFIRLRRAKRGAANGPGAAAYSVVRAALLSLRPLVVWAPCALCQSDRLALSLRDVAPDALHECLPELLGFSGGDAVDGLQSGDAGWFQAS